MEPRIYKNLNLERVFIRDKDFSYARFEDCEFKNIIVSDVKFENCVFVNCVFYGDSSFYNCTLDTVFFLNSSIEYSSIKKMCFYNCIFCKTDFTACIIKGVFFQKDCACIHCDIQDNDFLEAEIRIKFDSCTIYSNFYTCNFLYSKFTANNVINIYDFYHNYNCGSFESIEPHNLFLRPGIDCPSEGSYIAFKKVWSKNGRSAIAKLEIPADAKRSSAGGPKCRASKAKVLSIVDKDCPNIYYDKAFSQYNVSFIYRVGETVEVKDFDDNRWEECAPGIHHFLDKYNALNY
jgi:hypothetical protein